MININKYLLLLLCLTKYFYNLISPIHFKYCFKFDVYAFVNKF